MDPHSEKDQGLSAINTVRMEEAKIDGNHD